MTIKLNYLNSGVNVELANKLAGFLKNDAATESSRVISGIGGFASIYDVSNLGKHPCIVSCTDGVGTKLKIAFILNKHNTVGIDLVAMSANDLVAMGAEPLFFLDYIATGELEENRFKEIMSGINKGCKIAKMSLIGGETAEMPGFYSKNEYDLAGFAVGWVERDQIIDGRAIRAGDRIIGIESNGAHSNGYSLIRKLILENRIDLDSYESDFSSSIGEALLKPTYIYTEAVKSIMKFSPHAICHITGGGFFDNINRILPRESEAVIKTDNIPKQPLFLWLTKLSNMENDELYATWNMGVGMAVILSEENLDEALRSIKNTGMNAFEIGYIKQGNGVKIE